MSGRLGLNGSKGAGVSSCGGDIDPNGVVLCRSLSPGGNDEGLEGSMSGVLAAEGTEGIPTPFPRSMMVPGGTCDSILISASAKPADSIDATIIHRTTNIGMAISIRSCPMIPESGVVMRLWATAFLHENARGRHPEPDRALHSRPVRILHLRRMDGAIYRSREGDALHCPR